MKTSFVKRVGLKKFPKKGRSVEPPRQLKVFFFLGPYDQEGGELIRGEKLRKENKFRYKLANNRKIKYQPPRSCDTSVSTKKLWEELKWGDLESILRR